MVAIASHHAYPLPGGHIAGVFVAKACALQRMYISAESAIFGARDLLPCRYACMYGHLGPSLLTYLGT